MCTPESQEVRRAIVECVGRQQRATQDVGSEAEPRDAESAAQPRTVRFNLEIQRVMQVVARPAKPTAAHIRLR